MRDRRWIIGFVVAVVACVVVAGCQILPGSDEFNKAKLETQWTAINRPGDASNRELQCYRPANVAQSSGRLVITTKADTSCPGYRYTSGMVQWTRSSFTYGTLEFRAKFAGGVGTWPAVWMLGSKCQLSNITSPDNVGTCSWPNPGSDEIDVAEILGGSRTRVNQGLITRAGSSNSAAYTTDVSTNWHTYTLRWAPGSLTWKIDGRTTCTMNKNVPSTPMFVMVNTAVGGSGGGSVINFISPQRTYVDYIRVIR